MEQLAELVARILIAKGVEYAIAYAIGNEVAVAASNSPGCGSQCDPLARCRMRGRLDLEDDCYAWDEPSFRRH